MASVLVLGGALRWAIAVVAVILAAAIATQISSKRAPSRRQPLLVMIGVAAALTALQLVPVPAGLRAALSPTSEALRADGAALSGIGAWPGLSLDPAGTLQALATLVVVLAAAWLALRTSNTESGRYRVLAAVAGVCGATAALVGLHELVGARALYGVYTPEQARPSVLGPLLNENHLGSLMALGAITTAGLAMYPRQRTWRRAAWSLVVVVCAVTAVATQSRGATLALIAGGIVFVGIIVCQRLTRGERALPMRPSALMTSLPITVVAVCAIIVIVYASASSVSDQLSRTSMNEVANPTSKFAVWLSSRQLVEEAPLVGVGRGAFEPAATRIHPASAIATFSHLENEYLQAVVDWGLPGALLLALAGMFVVTTAIRRWRDGPLAAGALGAISVVTVHSVFDFGLELIGLAIPTVAVLATLTCASLREVDGRALRIARAGRIGLVAACLVGAVALFTPVTTTIAEDHRALRTADRLSFAALEDAFARHPLDYYPYALAAQVLIRDGDPRAVRFLNHAMRLHPTHPALHHTAARMLLRSGRAEQAAIEYASALAVVPNVRPLVEEVLAKLPPPLAGRALPVELVSRPEALGVIMELAPPVVANGWLERVLDAGRESTRACDSLWHLARRTKDADAAELAGERCTGQLTGAARYDLAVVLQAAGRLERAQGLIADVESWRRVDDRVQGWLLSCDLHEARGAFEQAKRCLRRLDLSGGPRDADRAAIVMRLARIDAALAAANGSAAAP